MGDWSDDEKSAAPKTVPFGQVKSAGNDNGGDDWGNNDRSNNNGDSMTRGRGRGSGGGYNNRGNRDFNNENGDRPPRRNFNRDDNNEGGDRPPRRNYNRDDNNEGGDRPPRRNYNRDDNENGDRPPRRNYNRDDNNEGGDRPPRRDYNREGEGNDGGDGEEKKREIYIPEEPTDEDLFASAISAGINFDNFDKIDVHVTGNGAEDFAQINTFAEANLRDFLMNNVTKSGYKKPTPIQKRAIPIIKAKRDLMGCAQTGSGKTAAFVLPILDTIMNDKSDLNNGKPQCLILAPTRELVIQIRDEAMKFANGSYVKVCLAYGGAASRYQSENITQGVHILVATPGRLMDFLNKGVLSFEDLKYLVLDEADRMLDMGFRDTIDTVCNHSSLNRDDLTILMFSATFPDEIQRLAAKYLRNYLFLTVGIVGGASADVDQEFVEVARKEKRSKLMEMLKQYCECSEEDRILVFVETKRTADYLASFISETAISSTSIHGDRLQREREEALRDFRTGKRKVLIATAVAARGLDIKGVTHVINYDLPKEIDEYIHRIGRTGRVGNRGRATSFFDFENDANLVGDLVRILTQSKQPIPGFFNSSGGGNYGEAEKYGGSDIRQPIAPAAPQQEEEDW